MPIAATIVVLRSSSLSIPVIPAPKNILVEAVVIAELELGRCSQTGISQLSRTHHYRADNNNKEISKMSSTPTTIRFIGPKGNAATSTFNGRAYSVAAAATIDVPAMDAGVCAANGWVQIGNGSGTTAPRREIRLAAAIEARRDLQNELQAISASLARLSALASEPGKIEQAISAPNAVCRCQVRNGLFRPLAERQSRPYRTRFSRGPALRPEALQQVPARRHCRAEGVTVIDGSAGRSSRGASRSDAALGARRLARQGA